MVHCSDSAPATHARSSPSGRKWLFRSSAVVIGLLPFVVLEAALRLIGYGYDNRLVIPAPLPAAPNRHILNPATDRAYFGRADLPGPEPRPFPLPKPADGFRIVVVGGSTVTGFPYPIELSFPRHLQVILQEQNPGRT